MSNVSNVLRLGVRSKGLNRSLKYRYSSLDVHGPAVSGVWMGPGNRELVSFGYDTRQQFGWLGNRVIVRNAPGRTSIRLDGRPKTGSGVKTRVSQEAIVGRFRERNDGIPVDLEVVDLSKKVRGADVKEARVPGVGPELVRDLSRAVSVLVEVPSAQRLLSAIRDAREGGKVKSDLAVLRGVEERLGQLPIASNVGEWGIGGYRLEAKGRLRGGDRASSWACSGGTLKRSSLTAGADTAQETVYLKSGTLGLKFYVNYSN